MCFLPSCSQCPQCCQRTECRGKVTNVLAYLAGDGCKSSGGFHSERWLCPSFQNETSSDKITPDSEQLCKSGKELVPQRGIAHSDKQVGSGKSGYQIIPCFLQPAISSPKAQQKMETNLGPHSIESVPQSRYLQDVNPRNNPTIFTKGEWVTSLDFSDAYFHIPISKRSRKYLRFFLNNQTYQLMALPFGLATAPLEFTKVVKEVKLMAQARGFGSTST